MTFHNDKKWDRVIAVMQCLLSFHPLQTYSSEQFQVFYTCSFFNVFIFSLFIYKGICIQKC